MQSRPRSIELAEYQEELLPSGRKLLHCIFKDKFGTFTYKWTAPWKGEVGVEKLFFKALEIEEWNDYEGAWSKELRQASKEIPSLEEMELPVRIQVGQMAEVIEDRLTGEAYRAAIEVLSDQVRAWQDKEGEELFLCIGEVKISYRSLSSALLKQRNIKGISEGIEDFKDWVESGPGYGDWERLGICFYVWLDAGLDKTAYQVMGRQLASDIRSFIRKRLSDHRALKRGFEEL